MKLTEDIIRLISTKRPIPVATFGTYNNSDITEITPNLVYISFMKVYDDETIIIADNKLYKTKMNLQQNGKIAITVYDEVTNKSYQIKGNAKLVSDGEIYEETVKWVQSRRPSLTPRSAVVIKVEDIYSKDKKLTVNNGAAEFVKGLI